MIDLAAGADIPLRRRTAVCVVGAGVAGQTVARRLAAHGKPVLLVESGGIDFNHAVQMLAAGPNLGRDYYDLADSRLRMLGGTTAIWGGRCAALDRIDFERRDWVPHSGWPISYDALEPYVDEAYAALGVTRPRSWRDLGVADPGADPGFDPAKIDARIWSFDDKAERFTTNADLSDPAIEIVLNASLTRIDLAPNGTVASLAFESLNGRRLTVEATHFVLAAGGIETARLLLACAPQRPEGLGNGHDLVGRFFMEHPHARGGEIVPVQRTADAYWQILRLSRNRVRHRGKRFAAAYRPADAVQRELGILNTAFSIAVRRHEGQARAGHQRVLEELKHALPAKRRWRRLHHAGKWVLGRLRRPADAGVAARVLRQSAAKGIYAVIRAEQAPNPLSRVKLVDERDALGVRRAGLEWRLSAIDRHTVPQLMRVLGTEVQRMGLGTVKPAAWLRAPEGAWETDELVSRHAIGGYHHLGTTRMAATARDGVVDAECRVFEAPNLYIAGSSVFPTGGWANPTVTIMALAMRLGDHLAR